MTRVHLRANWIGPPSPTGLWIGALLRAFAMFVLYAANFFRMRLSRLSRECHVDVTPATLPEPESGIILETKEPAASSQTTAQRQLTCVPPTRPTVAPVVPPIARPTGTRTGTQSGHRIADWNYVWDFITNLDSRMRTDITHA